MDQLVIDAARLRLEQLRCEERQLEAAICEAENRAGAKPRMARKPRGSKRILSPEARKRIADAQKKRWSEFRKKKVA